MTCIGALPTPSTTQQPFTVANRRSAEVNGGGTLTRHFRPWSGKTAGPTYSRDAAEIAVRLTPSGAAVAAQDTLICRLHPRDNTKADCDPF